MVIYLTTNLINGKKYIGMDSKNNPKYLGSGTLILKAIKKYGKENFKKEILEVCNSKQELELRESYWIKYFNALEDESFYNLEDNLKRSIDPFYNKTEEEKRIIFEKRGKSQKGKPKLGNRKPKPIGFSEQQKERFKNRGPRSEESKRKQSTTTKGKNKHNLGKKWIQNSKSKSLKPILQYDIEGNFIKEWPSIKEASEQLNLNRRNISNNLTNKNKSAFGFIWKYK